MAVEAAHLVDDEHTDSAEDVCLERQHLVLSDEGVGVTVAVSLEAKSLNFGRYHYFLFPQSGFLLRWQLNNRKFDCGKPRNSSTLRWMYANI